ncbi:MAG: TonB-dependent receptor [Ignavibacteria bacterium]|nr:TonB-dependent receptor [Ignavibacteria bacterium]
MFIRKVNIIICVLILSVAIYAQKKSDSISYAYPHDITVSGLQLQTTGVQQSFQPRIITGDKIGNEGRGFAADEIFRMLPGIKIDNQANGARVHVSMRGIGILSERGIRGINFYLDGVPLNDPSSFAPDLFDVDANNIANVEVLRGCGNSLYGRSSAGGIVDIKTKVFRDEKLSGEASHTFGSNRYESSNAVFGAAAGKFGFNLSASHTKGDGYRDHTSFYNDNYYGQVNFLSEHNLWLNVIGGYSHTYHQNPEGVSLADYNSNPKIANGDAAPFNEGLETERLTGAITGYISVAEGVNLRVLTHIKHTFFTEANNKVFTHREFTTPGGSMYAEFGYGNPGKFGAHEIQLGIDGQYQQITERQFDNYHSQEGDTLRSNSKIKQSGIGAFITDRFCLGNNLFVNANLRVDNMKNELTDELKSSGDLSGDRNFSNISGKIGLQYQIMEKLNIYAGWGQGFLPPATEELVNNPVTYGGFNSNLSSSTSGSFELGLKDSRFEEVKYEVVGFYMTTKNDFDRFRVPGRGDATFYRNIDGSRRIGAEISADLTLCKELKLDVAYTYSKFTYKLDNPMQILMNIDTRYIQDGNVLPNSPEHQVGLNLSYSPVTAVTAVITMDAFSKSYIDGSNKESEACDGYALFGAALSYTARSLNDATVSVRFKNIFDKKYVAFSEPDPDGNSYQPGAGREMFASIKVHF